MAILIEKDEATAARRRVPCRLFTSNGTSPDTGALNDAVIMGTNSLATFSLASTLRAVHAAQGMYCVELTQSEVSVLGTHPLYHTVGDFPQHIATVQVVNDNPMSTQSGVLLGNQEYSAVTVRLGLVDYSGASVGARNIAPGIYSAVSLSIRDGGIQPVSVGAGNYSGMSVEIKTRGIETNSIRTAAYSGVTLGIDNIAAGTYSGVTVNADNLGRRTYSDLTVRIEGVSYSGLTVQGVTRVNSSVTPADALYSAVTVRIEGVSYSGLTIDGARFLSAAGERSAASSYLSTNIGNSRLIQEAYFLLRNRVQISGSTMTVFLTDDTTSSWTASVTTSTSALAGIDPGGA